jgi:hypothetical protein
MTGSKEKTWSSNPWTADKEPLYQKQQPDTLRVLLESLKSKIRLAQTQEFFNSISRLRSPGACVPTRRRLESRAVGEAS